MGANESAEIQVTFNHSNLFYYAGEQVTGTISFHNTHEKLKLDEVFLEFIGELGFTTQETRNCSDTDGRARTEHYTEYHRIPFMNIRVPVVQPQNGQHDITLYRGQHSWPFEFVLPHCLPPSSVPSTLAYPYVKYYTRIVLDKSWYKPNTKQVYTLIIFPRVDLCQFQNPQQPLSFSHSNRKKVHLQGSLLQNAVLPGDKISLEVNLQNPKRREIKRIEATLIQHRQIAQSHQIEIIFRKDLPDIINFNEAELHRTFDLLVPLIQLAPTYAYMPQCCGPLLGINFYYELKLEVKAHGLFTDFRVNVPVIVATELTCEMANNSVEMEFNNLPAYDYDEPPPTYESTIADEKK